MIVQTKFIPKNFAAFSCWPFIFVLPSHASNAGLIEHETVHYNEQSWVTPIWLLRYFLSKSFRLAAEVRAYKRQIAVGGISIPAATMLLLKYDLGITHQEACLLVSEPSKGA